MRSVDDRGRSIELMRLDRAMLKRPLDVPMKITDPQRKRNDSMMREVMVLNVMPLTILLCGSCFMGGINPNLPCITASLALGLMILLLVRFVQRLQRVDAIHWLTAGEICGACGHSLRGLCPEKDGCHVCPECGAAWQMPQWSIDPL